MSKTVLFGGTFNPPHLGHERLLGAICEREDVDRVLLIPTFKPVHKAGRDLAPSADRLNMCRKICEKFSKASVWDTELTRKTKSYTYYTLLQYRAENDDVPYFLMGADMLVTLSTWYEWQEILKLCRILAVFREGENREEFDRDCEKLRAVGAEIEIMNIALPDISSTDVRRAAAEGKSLRGLVSPVIEEYISAHKLYKGAKDMTTEQYKEHIKARLSEKRYFHSLCVAEEAVRLADRYGANGEQAYIAGLLHDVLKDTPPEEQLKFAKQFGIILSDLELNAPKLYHSIIGSAYVKEVLGVRDPEIISAIRCHTTAKANMTLLEKILYLADYTSRDRDYDGVEEMRAAVEKDLSSAMRVALKFTVDDLKAKGCPVHPDTLAAYHQYFENEKD